MNTPVFWAIGLVLAITQLINLTYFEGLNSDFSDLALQVVSGNGTYDAPYTVVDKADGEWIAVNATLPEGGDYTLNVLSSSDLGPDYSETSDPSIIEVPYQEGFAPDFSNLAVAFVSASGVTTPATHSIVGMSRGQWAIIALPRAPMAGETVSFMIRVGDVAPGLPEEREQSGQGESDNGTLPESDEKGEPPPPAEQGNETTQSGKGPLPELQPEAQGNGTAQSEEPPQIGPEPDDGANPGGAASVTVKDARGREHHAGGGREKGLLRMTFDDLPVRKIEFIGLRETNNSLGLDFPEGVPAPEGAEWEQVYAIDPTGLEFESASVTVVARGNALYKCREWDFAAQECGGEWILLRDDLIPGGEYEITLTPEDPAFGEMNITVINVQSYPVVGGNWTVEFTTSGTADLRIRAVNGTEWDDDDPGADLNFLELRCGGTVISPVWDDEEKTALFGDFHCDGSGFETSRVLTSGAHHLEFAFGDDVDYAHNDAGDLVVTGVEISGFMPDDDLVVSYYVNSTSADTAIVDWRLNGSSIAILNYPLDMNVSSTSSALIKDYSNRQINGSLVTSYVPTWRDSPGCVSGGCYDFDNDYIYVASPDHNIGSGPFTIEAWVNPDTISGYDCIASFGTYSPGFYLTNGYLNLYPDGSSTNAISVGAWHHVAVTRDAGGAVTFYINGTSNGTSTYSTAVSPSPFYIGYQSGETFDGRIDEFRLYNRSLSPEQILAIYNSGVPSHNVTKSNETGLGEQWSACVTASNSTQDGLTNCSSNVTISLGSPVSSCQAISSSGAYALTGDLQGRNGENPECIWINASDVILDCQGHSITNSEAGLTYGILVNDSVSGFTLQNCPDISNYTIGIYLLNTGGHDISGAGLYGNDYGFLLGYSDGNSFSDIVAQGNDIGAILQDSEGNSITDSNLSGNLYDGIRLIRASSTLLDPSYFCNNGGIGISVNLSDDVLIEDSIICNNTGNGIEVSDSDNLTITGSRLFNNSRDFQEANSLGSPASLGMSNVTFDRPEGDLENYTTISLNDSVSDSSSFYMDWSAESAAIPEGNVSIGGKFLQISALSGTVSLDSFALLYLQADVSPYNESTFSLYEHNSSGWTLLNGTPDTEANEVSPSGLVPHSTYALLGSNETPPITCVNLSDATTFGDQVFNLSGVYYVNNDTVLCTDTYTTTGHMIVMNASNITLDCNGANLSGDYGSSDYGIQVANLGFVTVKNCVVHNFGSGIYLSGTTNNATIDNNTITNMYAYGIYLHQFANGNNITNNNITPPASGGNFGVYLYYADYNYLYGNNVSADDDGFYLSYSDYNTLVNNTATSRTDNGFYIYSGSYNTFINNSAINNYDYGFYVYSASNAFSGNNASFNSQSGFYVYSLYNDIADNHMDRNGYYGVYLGGGDYNNLTGNTVYGNTQYGFNIYSGANNNIMRNNRVYGNSYGSASYGGYYFYANSGNLIENDTVYGNGLYGIYYYASTGNSITDTRVFNHTSDVYIQYSTSGQSVYFRNLTIDNPAGTMENYTVLDVFDNTTAAATYIIDWTGSPASLPAERIPFRGKFVNITNTSGAVEINSINWTWADDEITSEYTEAYFELWKNNGSWSMLNYTLFPAENKISMADMSPASVFGILDWNVTHVYGCMEITVPGTAHLANDLEGANVSDDIYVDFACVKLSSPDIVLDCLGHTIANNGTPDVLAGIVLNSSSGSPYQNVTIQNCPSVSGYDYGAYLPYAEVTVRNSSLSDNDYNVYATNRNVTLANVSLFNASANDLRYSNNAGSDMSLNLANVLFLRPAGDSTNFTNLSLYDVAASGSAYYLNWSSEPVPDGLPASRVSVLGRFLDIATISGSVSLDQATWHWTQGEIPGYDELLFELWKHNASNWTMLNDSPDTGADYISVFNHDPASTYALLENQGVSEITGCMEITEGGTYQLMNGLSGANISDASYPDYSCIKIASDDVIFNCGGYPIENNGTGGTTYGILVNGTSSKPFSNVVIRNCPNVSSYSYGVMPAFAEVDLLNLTLSGNGRNLYLSSSNSTISGLLAYNGTQSDFTVGGSGVVNATGMAFANPAGTLENFTNISVNDSTSGESYSMSWGPEPAALPPNTISFEGRHLSFGDLSGTVSIDAIAWTWLDSELAGYNESKFQLWEYDSGASAWSNRGAALDAESNALALANLDPKGTFSVLQTTALIDNCPVISESGEYYMGMNFTGAPNNASATYVSKACVIIAANDVIFDCNGYNITNNGTADAGGIAVNGTSANRYRNITIRNCPAISQYEEDIYAQYLDNSTILNVTVFNSADSNYGIYTYYGRDINITNNTAYDTSSAIYVSYGLRHFIANNTLYSNTNGLYLYYTTGTSYGYHTVASNNATNNTNNGIYILSVDRNIIRDNLASNNNNAGIYLSSDYSVIENNTITGNRYYGIQCSSCDNDNFISNNITNTSYTLSGTYYGIYLDGNSNNLTGNLIGNTSSTSSTSAAYGIFIDDDYNSLIDNNVTWTQGGGSATAGAGIYADSAADYNNITGGIIADSSRYGMDVYRANNTRINGVHIFNSTLAEMRFRSYSTTRYDIYVANAIIDNPLGDYQNFTNLSFNDTPMAMVSSVYPEYMVKWTSNTSALPAEMSPFFGRFVNITPIVQTTSLEWLALHYTDAESGGYEEDFLELWKYNTTGWTLLNDTADEAANTLSVFDHNISSVYAILKGETGKISLANCTEISSNGSYILAADLEGAPIDATPLAGNACIKISSSNVTLDCDGYSISGNTSGTTYGILLSGPLTGVTVRNCAAIGGYGAGIHVQDGNESVFRDNSAFGTASFSSIYGYYIGGTSSNNTFISNVAHNVTQQGFKISFAATRNNISGSDVYDSSVGFSINGNNNTIERNSVYRCSSGYEVEGAADTILEGNFAQNITSQGYWTLGGATGTTFINNTARNTTIGFDISGSGNHLANNTAYENSGFGASGFRAFGSDDLYENNTAYGNGVYGFYLAYASGINLSGNTAHGNGEAGIMVEGVNNTRMSADRMYNNALDLGLNATAAMDFYASNIIFDSPSGPLVNYTALSINDSLASASAYGVNWSAQPAALPAGNTSIRGKFVNITPLDGAVSLDSFVLHWLASDVGLYFESTFSLYEHNSSGWTLLNGTPDTALHQVSYSGLVPHSEYGLLGSNETVDCVNLSDSSTFDDKVVNVSGVYYVINDTMLCPDTYYTSQSMIYMNDSDITLDCAGSTLDGDLSGTTDYGIYINGFDNVTVENCFVRDFYHGVLLTNSSNYNTFRNVTSAYNNYHGFFSNYSSNNTYQDCIAYNHTGTDECGFHFYLSHYNNLTGNLAYDNYIGIYFTGGMSLGYNSLENNSAINNSYRGFYIGGINRNNLTNNRASGTGTYDGFYFSYSDYNLVFNNTAGENARSGFYVYDSNNNTFINNTAYGQGEYGFTVRTASNYNLFSNNSAFNNGDGGYYLDLAHYNRIENETIRDNGLYGIHSYQCSFNNITNVRLFNHTSECYFSYSAIHRTASLSNVTIDNPSGTLQNFTVIDLYDSGIGGEAYSIAWSASPATLPSERSSFAGKFINITNTSGTITINSANWTWAESELAGYDEDYFELWKYNSSGWTLLNGTPDTTANMLSLASHDVGSTYAILERESGITDVTDCMEITSGGSYQLANNLEGAPHDASPVSGYACIKIASSDVTLDCDGFNLTANFSGSTMGIVLNGSLTNVTVRNCFIGGYGQGIHVNDSNGSLFANNSAYGTASFSSISGYYIGGTSSNNAFISNVAHNVTQHGFKVSFAATGNNISGSDVYDSSVGFSINGNNNTIERNSVYRCSSGYEVEGAADTTLEGNLAQNITSQGYWTLGGASGTTFINNTARNTTLGFKIEGDGHLLANNTAYAGTSYGFHLSYGSGNNMSGNLAFNNSAAGILVESANNTRMSADRMYNNALDLDLNATFAMELHASNIIFDSPAGILQNFTNLSINDSLPASSAYTINWTSNESALPAGTLSFRQKFVNITAAAGTVSLDSAAWHWTDDEASGYPESSLALYEYNSSGWAVIDGSPDTGANEFVISNLEPHSGYGILQSTSVANCMEIGSAGVYELSSGLEGAPISASPRGGTTCIKITASDVTLDCNGFSIINNGTADTSRAILALSDLANVTLRNCPSLTNYSYGIELYRVNDSVIANNTLAGNYYAILISSSHYVNITDNLIDSATTHGIFVNSSNSSTVTGNTVNDVQGLNGIYIASSHHGTIDRNSVDDAGSDCISLLSSRNASVTNNNASSCVNGIVNWAGFYGASFDCHFENNTAWNNTQFGFYIYTQRNTLVNNTAYNNSMNGFELFIDNIHSSMLTAYDNLGDGISLSYCDNCTLSDSAAYRNGNSGVYLGYAPDAVLSDNRAYNNSRDLLVNLTDFSTIEISVNRMLFLNPSGTLENYTNLTLQDSVENYNAYSMNWTANESAVPPNLASFGQKFLNITPLVGEISLENISWSWLDTEPGAANESYFALWKHNSSGWSVLNSSPDTSANTLSLIKHEPEGIYGIMLDFEVNCPVIETPGPYTMNKSYTGAPNDASPITGTACVKINASDVLFDCNGHSITHDGSKDTYGIIVGPNVTNITIQNCPNITRYDTGVNLHHVNESIIRNITLYNNSYRGMYVHNSAHNAIDSNRFVDNAWDGLYMLLYSDFNNITNNNVSGHQRYGLILTNGAGSNNVVNNTAFDNGGCAIDVGGWGLSNNVTGNLAYDNGHPSGYAIGICIRGSNVTAWNNTARNNSRDGFWMSGQNHTLRDNLAELNVESGFYASEADLILLENNTARDNGYDGIHNHGGNNDTLRINMVYNNTQNGIVISWEGEGTPAYDTLITGNEIYSNGQAGILLNAANRTIIDGNHLYNNSAGLFVWDFLGYAGSVVNVTGLIFDNPAGDYANFTNLSLNDTYGAYSNYSIRWTTNSSALPFAMNLFEGKIVNISNHSESVSIDAISWSWLDSESAGHNESRFGLWKYNSSGWAPMNGSADTVANTISLYGMNPASDYGILSDEGGPLVVWHSQYPPDIDSLNALDIGVNITYNITDPSGIDPASPILYYKTNTSTSDCWTFVNGSYGYCGYRERTPESNESELWLWRLYDNQIYPATYNIDERGMETTAHSAYNLATQNNPLKIQLLNVSNITQYGFFEVMANISSGTSPLRIFYCNESYSAGNPSNSPSCTNFYSLPYNQPYNHSHSEYSYHMFVPFAMNASSGLLGNVRVTSTSYFILRPAQGSSWNVYYISNVSRPSAIQTSANNGNAWSDFAGTVDSHLHQYDPTDRLWYYACANDTLGNHNCSAEFYDYLNLSGIPPTAPDVYSPTNDSYCGSVPINYTAAISPNGYNISHYNISLMNSDFTFNKTILGNNSLNLSYEWDASGTAPGNYSIRVEACDTEGQCSSGYSLIFNYTGPCSANCPVITAPGEYSMNFNYTGAPNDASEMGANSYACLKIAASDVEWDCQGYSIINGFIPVGYIHYGILLNGSLTNVTVKNCNNLTGYSYGLLAYQSNGSVFLNNSAWNSEEDGIVLSYCFGSNLTNNTANGNGACGISVDNSSSNNVTGNEAHNNGDGFCIYSSDNNTVAGNNATGNSGSGFELVGSDGNVLDRNAAFAGQTGFAIWEASSGNTVKNSDAGANGVFGGIFVDDSDSVVLANNTLYDNAAGIFLSNSTTSALADNALFNNSADLALLYGSDLIMNNTLFLNPSGTLENFTNLSINDSLGPAEGYMVSWAANASAPPFTHFSFGNKYVNITNLTSGVSVDRAVWHWTSAEAAGHDESAFELLRYNESHGWTLQNSSPDTINRELTLFAIDEFSQFGIFEYNYSGCVNLSNPLTWGTRLYNSSGSLYVNENTTLCRDTYYMDVDIFAVSLLYMNVSNIYLDCNDSVIDGVDYNGRGVQIGYFGMGTDPPAVNDTIRNCLVRNFRYGFLVQSTSNNTLHNLTAFNNTETGFDVYLGGNNTIYGARASFGQDGFFLHSTSNNSLRDSLAENNTQYGIYEVQSSLNAYSNASAKYNGGDGFHSSDSASANISSCAARGNGGSGFYFQPGKSPGYTFHTISASESTENVIDGYTVFQAFSNRFTSSNASGNGAAGISIFMALDTTIDPSWFCNNTDGIVLNNTYDSIIDDSVACNNTGYGIVLQNANNTLVNRSLSYNNSYGLYQLDSNFTAISGSNLTNNTNDGLRFDSGSGNNTLVSTYVCFNGLDLNNQGASNSGDEDRCDSFMGWSENGHYGCEYSCSSMWHRFFGDVNGTIILRDNSSANLFFSWNATGYSVYFADYDSAVSWADLQAIGRDTSGAQSSNDFVELDTAFGTASYSDNINRTYSSDGSVPLEAAGYSVFGLPIANVPVANSTAFNTSFDTGILWDMSDDGGDGEYDTADRETTVWVVAVNASSADVYGTYDFLIQVPESLATYEGSNELVSVYLELQ